MKAKALLAIKACYLPIVGFGTIAIALFFLFAFVDHEGHKDDPRVSDRILATGLLYKTDHIKGTWGQAECWDLTFEDGSTSTVYFDNVFRVGKVYNIYKTNAGSTYARMPGQPIETIGP